MIRRANGNTLQTNNRTPMNEHPNTYKKILFFSKKTFLQGSCFFEENSLFFMEHLF